jgi:hypothetical protein
MYAKQLINYQFNLYSTRAFKILLSNINTAIPLGIQTNAMLLTGTNDMQLIL